MLLRPWRSDFVHHKPRGAGLADDAIMRISGPISVQRPRPSPGWSAYGPRIVVLQAPEPPPRIAPTLPPQQRGDAASLTLLMAQTLGGGLVPQGAYAPALEDDGPIFAVCA